MSNRAAAYLAMQTDWHRWQMQDLDEPTLPESELPDTPPPSAAEIAAKTQAELEQAQQRGHQQGYDAGHEQGWEAGHKMGLQEGHESGLKTGYEAGMALAQEELAEHKAKFEALLLASSTSIGKLNESMGQALITLAIDIAEHVLGDTLQQYPHSMLPLISQILHLEPGDQSLLTLYLHPDDLDIVKNYLLEQSESRPWRLQADSTLQRGDCIARSAYGEIDASLRTRWRRSLGALANTPYLGDSSLDSESA